jgi:ActR/RegA family two-component response regulator
MKTILIIEDSTSLQESYKRSLLRKGEFEFETAITANGAIGKFSGANFDHVICDYNLEQGTGRDVFYWLQENRPDQLKHFTFVCGMPSEVSDLDAPALNKSTTSLFDELLANIEGYDYWETQEMT